MQGWPYAYTPVDKPPFEQSIYRLWDHKAPNGVYITWASIHTGPGSYDWTQLDGVASELRARGMRLWYCISSTPNWLATGGDGSNDAYGFQNGHFACGDNAEAANFATALMQRYGDIIDVFEGRNEATFDTSLRFYSGSAAALAATCRAMRLAAKAVKPSVKFIGMSDWSAGNKLITFLNASDGSGGFGRDSMDWVAVHPYGWFWHQDTRYAITQRIEHYMLSLRANMASGGLAADMPIVFGETGYSGSLATSEFLAATPADFANWIQRMTLGAIALGVRMIFPYAWDTLHSGNPSQDSKVRAAWERCAAFCLRGGTLREVVYRETTGEYLARTDAGVTVFPNVT